MKCVPVLGKAAIPQRPRGGNVRRWLSKGFSCVWRPEEKQALVSVGEEIVTGFWLLQLFSPSLLTSLGHTAVLHLVSPLWTPASLPGWHQWRGQGQQQSDGHF